MFDANECFLATFCDCSRWFFTFDFFCKPFVGKSIVVNSLLIVNYLKSSIFFSVDEQIYKIVFSFFFAAPPNNNSNVRFFSCENLNKHQHLFVGKIFFSYSKNRKILSNNLHTYLPGQGAWLPPTLRPTCRQW